MTGIFFLVTEKRENSETLCEGKIHVLVCTYLTNLSKGNLTDQQNFTDPSECISAEIDRFNGFTVEEKCFDKHEDSMYLQQCRYYIEVNIRVL